MNLRNEYNQDVLQLYKIALSEIQKHEAVYNSSLKEAIINPESVKLLKKIFAVIPKMYQIFIDAVHVGEHAIAIIEHTMTAHIANWGEAEWKSKCFKYFKMFECSSKPAYVICTTNFTDHRDTKFIPYDDMHVCFVFKISINDKIEDIKDIKKQFHVSDSLGYILKTLFTS